MDEAAQSAHAIEVTLAKQCSWIFVFPHLELEMFGFFIVLELLPVAVSLHPSVAGGYREILQIPVAEASLHVFDVLTLAAA